MSRVPGCLLLSLLLQAPHVAASVEVPVTVRSVDFGGARLPVHDDAHYEVSIRLRGERTQAVRGRGAFHRNIGVRLEMAYSIRGEPERHEYYRSSALLVGLAPAEERVVYFYLPPEVARRDRLNRPPDEWRVFLTVDERPLPNVAGTYSPSLQDPAHARRFLSHLNSEAPRNDGLLVPIYFTAFYHPESRRLADSPSYVRPEAGDAPASPGGAAP